MAKARKVGRPRTKPAPIPEPPVEEMAAAAPAAVDHTALLHLLAEINGQDSYDAKTAAVGKLSVSKYLKVPAGLAPFATEDAAIGTHAAREGITPEVYAQIYALNKEVFTGGDNQIKGALLRAELVRVGWYTGSYEVTEVAAPANAMDVMTADMPKIQEFQQEAMVLAILLPLAAEHTFRTMGHHFLTAFEADYVAKYNRFFAACVTPSLAAYLPPADLYHTVAHWVSLSKALAVVQNVTQQLRLPNAVVIRATAAPAGMALVTTSGAVLDAIAGTGLLADLKIACGLDTEVIMSISEEAKKDPAKYHAIPMAYGKGLLSTSDAATVKGAKEIAKKLAPVLQGFIDSLPKTSDLAQAKALEKHADVNPMMRKRAKTFFTEVGRSKATTMADLFSMDKRTTQAAADTEMDDD